MELREFVTTVLKQIIEGVQDAQSAVKGDGEVNPQIWMAQRQDAAKHKILESNSGKWIHLVEFDVDQTEQIRGGKLGFHFTTTYTSHYNKKLDKCFIRIDSTNSQENKKGDFVQYHYLYDVFEGKDYVADEISYKSAPERRKISEFIFLLRQKETLDYVAAIVCMCFWKKY